MFDDDFFDESESSMEDLLLAYEKIKEGDPQRLISEDEFELIIDYYFQNAQEEQALLACDIAQTYYPFSSMVLLLRAEILTQAQKYGQALKALDDMDQIDQYNLDSTLLRAEIYSSQHKNDQAAALLEDQLAHFSGKDKVAILLELTDIYDECEEFDDVFETLKKTLKLDPRNEEALQKISFWAEFTDRQDESIVLHTELTNEDPYNALAWFNLGAAYQGAKLYEKAIEAYEFCVAIDDKFEFAYRNLADAYIRLKWYSKALEVLETHLEIARPEDVIFEAMGHCWEKKKDLPRARYYYRKASQLNPNDDNIFYKIGETYFREQQFEKAVKSFTAALQLNHENAAYYLAMGNCQMAMDQKSKALVSFLNAVRIKPQNKTNWVALIRGLYYNRYYEEALSELDVAIDNCGNKPDFQFLKAAMLIELGKTKEALIYLEQGLIMAPTRSKLLTDLNPEYLRRPSVAELISRYKKR